MPMNDTNVVAGHLADEAATLALGQELAKAGRAGLVIYLDGDLGAGKTTFCRGFLTALGHSGRVKSPTYTLVESYPFANFTVHHFDLYRFADPEEWEDAGFRELFHENAVCLVEWPEKADSLLPAADLTLELVADTSGRTYHLHAATETGQQCLNRLLIQRADAS